MTKDDQINNTAKKCQCGKNMIKRGTGIVLCSNPPQYPMQWWCGGCGHTEDAGGELGVNWEDVMQKKWEEAQ